MKTDALYESLMKKVVRFREKWEEEISHVAYRTVTVSPKRGEIRNVYFVIQRKDVIKKFLSQRDALQRRIKEDREKLNKRDSDKAKKIDYLLPIRTRNCLGGEIRKYVARSQRNITSKQANAFARRVGKAIPEDATDFCIRSITGYRYTLVVRIKEGSLEFPVRSWSVIVSERPLLEVDAPSEVITGRRRATNKTWRKARNLCLLGKKGKSYLYCLINGS